ncbi:undecaprenyl-diphosphate phosphatase [Mangrovibacterium diazotrophicum]|uniref:Undecaprenyl-diphosphatase n=1 Tax=Mangrovibacterium diazotrophicum TaxID=1261403 RepID=A0A419WAW0_9BACT|nr:undecaprenyl-diphosphate phosphatase [Mangrovibacterium diazotrophicum]RKD92587.1 undecaprenyl-diphosphatase [Mangrovibacterium diazotrophicum]
MSLIQTIIIAIVEGLTEFLPVSSTGHMIIAQNMLGVQSTEFVKAFTVVIQLGAILSVIVLYWERFFKVNPGKIFCTTEMKSMSFGGKIVAAVKGILYKYDFYWKLLVAFIPAAVIGLIFIDQINSLLENVLVVAIMLVIGGVLMLFVDQIFKKVDEGQKITEKKAFMIGLAQCVAMIPGVSRSMATIVGGMSQRLTRKTAAEFSFFLAVPTMCAATAYKLLELAMEPNGFDIIKENLVVLLLGNVVAFVVAMLAIKFFIGFVTRYGFRAFGWYRIIVGGIIITLLLSGYNLEMI